MSSLCDRRDIVVKPADKGSAVVVMSTEGYQQEAERQLSSTVHYEQLSRDPTTKNNEVVRASVTKLLNKGSINKRTAEDLVERRPRPARFYMLPKIHKSLVDPPGRPIISSNGCPTERISAYVDIHLKPLVQSTETYIRDTKDFLIHLQSLPDLPPGTLLVTMDVVGLYTNIPHSEGLEAAQRMLDTRSTLNPPTEDLINLMEHVLNLNCFVYNNTHYRQKHGTAMGTKMAPSYANIFMADLERRLLAQAPGLTPELLKRFVDDMFMIMIHGHA